MFVVETSNDSLHFGNEEPHEPVDSGATHHDEESERELEVREALFRGVRVKNHAHGAYDSCRVKAESWPGL